MTIKNGNKFNADVDSCLIKFENIRRKKEFDKLQAKKTIIFNNLIKKEKIQ